jgi:membrane protease YdiL (CAAX protease family)
MSVIPATRLGLDLASIRRFLRLALVGAVPKNPFVALALYLAAIILVGGLLAWPVSVGLGTTLDVPFHRVLSRTLALTALVGVLILLRATGGISCVEAGFGSNRRSFLLSLAFNFAIGLVATAPLVVMLFVTGVREWAIAPTDATLERLAAVALRALSTGLVVGLLEETYFRGLVMQAALRCGRVGSALMATSLFFAVVHFLVPREDFAAERWYSGFQLVAAGLSDLRHPATIGAFVALTAAGLLLGAMRVRHRHIGGCVGFHAGWVSGYTLTHRLTDVTVANASSWLIGPDGVLGWLAFVWIVALLIGYVALRPPPRL